MNTQEIKVNLKKRNALITGSSRGIGAAIATQLAACGANVVLHYQNSKKQTEELAKRIKNQFNVKTLILQGDIADSNQFKSWFEKIRKTMGTIDILVNNASDEFMMDSLDFVDKNWDRIFAINVRAPLRLSQEVVKALKQQNKSGVILNISSIHDLVARKGFAHYTSSKAALHMLTKNLALEWAELGIRVIAISPGAVKTDRNRDEIAKVGVEKFASDIPLGRIADASEIAKVATFLVSDYCSYMTGTTVYVDGGYKENVIPHDPRKL